jgi:hypothetical protein
MEGSFIFYPPRGPGLIFQGAVMLGLVAAGLWSIWQATQARVGPVFLLYLLPALFALAVVPFLAYRAYAMWKASYILEREGLHIQWGLRSEEIPMSAVRWVRLSGEIQGRLPMPALRWPGAVLGVRRLPDGGEVEYLAAQSRPLVLVATPERIYAISPHDPVEFLKRYQQFAELGSLAPLPARSVFPSFLLARVWSTLLARYLLLAGLALSLILLAWVSLAVPSRPAISLGFTPEGIPSEPVPSVRLILLPVLNLFFYLASVLAGLYFFRSEGLPEANVRVPLAYLLWGSGALTPLLFLLGVFFILRAG